MPRNPVAAAGNINGRIRLAFARRQADNTAPDVETTEPKVVELSVVAYAEDCILSGRLPMAADRLSDLLNDNLEFEFADVTVEDLVGGAPIETRDIVVNRDELLLVVAGEPRGNPGRRNHTRQHAIVARIGPYEVRGLVHALPGSDPIESLRRRKPMIALTDATIEFVIGLTHHRRPAPVVIMNRDCVDSITEGQESTITRRHMPADRRGLLL
jgi:hypothetical protein